MGRGCVFCNCETEPSVRVCEGCFKLHETDWLATLPDMVPTDIVEVRFKNTRRSYYQNVNNLDLKRGDIIAVESSPGHDIGIVSLTGDMVARQMKRVGFNPLNGEFKKIYRKAKPYDIEKWQEAIAMEHETMIRSRQIAADMGLNMKIGDVEYQGDKIKAIFYYIADERVDFRELIKVFAEQFRIRVEMKQIGARQEAGRIGGLGSCGRELCCASWISSFVSVTTNSARAQEISLNPQKLAGQCSKLKCCLVYELDDYLDARREFPRVNGPLQALDGDYYLVKSDILGRTMSFSTSPNAMIGVVTLPISRVREIVDLNRKGRKVDKLEDDSAKHVKVEEPGFVDILGGESITRFDPAKGERPRSKRSGRRGGEHRGEESRPRREGDDRPRETPQRDGQRQGGDRRRDDERRQGGKPNNDRNRSNPGSGDGVQQPQGRDNAQGNTRGEGRPNDNRNNERHDGNRAPRQDAGRGGESRGRDGGGNPRSRENGENNRDREGGGNSRGRNNRPRRPGPKTPGQNEQ